MEFERDAVNIVQDQLAPNMLEESNDNLELVDPDPEDDINRTSLENLFREGYKHDPSGLLPYYKWHPEERLLLLFLLPLSLHRLLASESILIYYLIIYHNICYNGYFMGESLLQQ
jgi:hypothetical protein